MNRTVILLVIVTVVLIPNPAVVLALAFFYGLAIGVGQIIQSTRTVGTQPARRDVPVIVPGPRTTIAVPPMRTSPTHRAPQAAPPVDEDALAALRALGWSRSAAVGALRATHSMQRSTTEASVLAALHVIGSR